MIRLRVTDLDLWVRFLEPEREEFEVSLDDFLRQMRRESPATPDMKAGQAFHTLMERAQTGETLDGGLTGIEQDGFYFHFTEDFEVELPRGREDSVERIYQTPSGAVLLRGKVDASDPVTVTDYKLSSTFDAERYAASLQWRAYLDMTGAKRFRYLVFEGRRDERGDVWIYGLHRLEFWSYPEMHADVERRVGELADFLRRMEMATLVEVPA